MNKGVHMTGPARLKTPTVAPIPATEPKKSPSFSLTDAAAGSATKAGRRRFTAEYKMSILRLAEACTEPGGVGEVLQREGLYASHLAAWRRQRDEGILEALTPRQTGRKAVKNDPLLEENRNLRRENYRLAKQLRETELFIDLQKKRFTDQTDHPGRGSRERLMRVLDILKLEIGVQPACKALGIPRTSLYRRWGAQQQSSDNRKAL